ncbi:MAG: WG repeat-containing protein [Zoogloeaceae bacterium]|jgi:hypothetical protein|nr:WG repeat-containing protein [Zoogloeaceae bacterium]
MLKAFVRLPWVKSKYGYINEKGEAVIPPRFDDAWNFDANGLASVRVEDTWGYIRARTVR